MGALEVDEGLAKGRKQEKMMADETRAAMMVGGAREETKAGKPGGNLEKSQDEGPRQSQEREKPWSSLDKRTRGPQTETELMEVETQVQAMSPGDTERSTVEPTGRQAEVACQGGAGDQKM